MIVVIPTTNQNSPHCQRALSSMRATGSAELAPWENRPGSNIGFFAPLKLIATADTQHSIIGLAHDDIVIYEHGWDERIRKAFDADPKLMAIGFCGSDEVDHKGGRGHGTMGNFKGLVGATQRETGKRMTWLHPALVFDALFMAFRREALDIMEHDWTNLPIMHFYDKIWPMRLVERGYHVAVLGIECDHVGGQTAHSSAYRQACAEWFAERPDQPVLGTTPEASMYMLAEKRWLDEFRDKIPMRIDNKWRTFKMKKP